MAGALGTYSGKEDEFFDDLCNNISNCVTLHFQSILSLLKFNDGLMEHEMPTSVQLKFSLKSSQLQRTFMAMRSQIEELVRLTKLYSTSWEEKNQCIKALHQQYNIKQRRLDIALKKIEILSGRNKALEKLRIQVNWEKMFMKLNQNKSSSLGWRHVVSEYKENMAAGRSVGHLFFGLNESCDSPTKYRVDVESMNIDLDGSETDFDLGKETSLSCDSRLDRFSTDDEDELRFSSKQQQEDEADTKESNISNWISNSSQIESSHIISFRNVECQKVPETKEACLQTKLVNTTDKSSCTRIIKYKNSLNVLIKVPENILAISDDCFCTVALNNHLEKRGVRQESSDHLRFRFDFKFEEDFVFNSDEFLNTTVRIGFHRDDDEPMMVFAQSPLKDFRIPCIRENSKIITGDNVVPMRAAVDKYGFRCNQPCGDVLVSCYISQTSLPFQIDQSTETLSLNEIVEELLQAQKRAQLERCKSACVETEEKPVYTEHDLELVRDELTRKIQELKDRYEGEIKAVLLDHTYVPTGDDKYFSNMATSPVLMTPVSNHQQIMKLNDNKHCSKDNKTNGKRLQFSQQWGKDLPTEFLTRLDMFQDASEQYHKELKSKTNEIEQTAIKKKLNAEKKLWNGKQHAHSVFSRDVYLPAVFMPIKSKQQQPISGRSFLSQPIKSIQLPFLKSDNQKEHIFLKQVVSSQE